MKEHEKRNILVKSIYLGYFLEGSYGLSKFLTVYCSSPPGKEFPSPVSVGGRAGNWEPGVQSSILPLVKLF